MEKVKKYELSQVQLSFSHYPVKQLVYHLNKMITCQLRAKHILSFFFKIS